MFRFLLPLTQGLINLEKQMDSIPDSPIKPFNGIKLHALSPSQLKKKATHKIQPKLWLQSK